jgi:hypothetical protein
VVEEHYLGHLDSPVLGWEDGVNPNHRAAGRSPPADLAALVLLDRPLEEALSIPEMPGDARNG